MREEGNRDKEEDWGLLSIYPDLIGFQEKSSEPLWKVKQKMKFKCKPSKSGKF